MTNLPSLSDRTAAYIRKHGLISPGDHILAAVSGGSDSVALLDILTGLKDDLEIERITVAHFDHRLRGEESDADREYVRGLAMRARFDFRCGTADVLSFATEHKVSIEMAGRSRRHEFFQQTARDINAQCIALGHTASDQAEEVLLRLLRGAGPAGLRGMLPKARGGIIRPLLFASREEIIEHVKNRGITFRQDSSNFEPNCRRNALRLLVFPILRDAFNPEVVNTISRFAELARDEESWWEIQVRESWERCGEFASGRVELDIKKSRALHPALLRRLLRHGLEKLKGSLFGIQAVHVEPLFEIIRNKNPGKTARLPGDIEAVQRGGRLIIRKYEPSTADPFHAQNGVKILEINGPGIFHFGRHVIEIEFVDALTYPVPACPGEVLMDGGEIKLPLKIRYWRPGDRFHPQGMGGSKKLQDFFTDLKIPREDRHTIPILCDREKIVWVAGLRLDQRVKATPAAKMLIRAKLSRNTV